MKIAYGYAFGTFMSTTPLIGIKWIVALPVLWFTRWNKVACMFGIFHVNYFTGPLFYALAYFVGKNICGFENSFSLPDPLTFNAMKDILLGNADVFISILVGGLALSIPMTLGAFFFVKSIFSRKFKPSLT
jgi:uncharacterized protein (DUF2062 family)